MSSTSAAPSRVSRRAGPAGARASQQIVGEYVGEPAGRAAQAVRRAGLRPGLDRSFGCAPELVGQVVAQEPPAGGELPRNGLVTLFVAAPGAGPQEEAVAPVAPIASQPSEHEAPSPGARRRRKRRLAGSVPRTVPSPPPAPILPSDRPQRSSHTGAAADEITDELDVPAILDAGISEAASGLHEAAGDDALEDEQFVIHAADVFAGHTDPAWRRVYPLRRGSWSGADRVRSYFGERSPLVKVAVALVAVWIVVAVAVAFAGSSTQRHPANAVSAPVRSRATDGHHAPVDAHARSSVRTERGRTRASVDPRRPPPRRRRHPSTPSSAPAPPEQSSAAPAAPTQAAPAVSRPAPAQAAPPASAPAPPARQQTPGGLFSP